jgi:hypothetical protein
MRLAVGILVAVSACYAPLTPSGAPCDLSANNCPIGQKCQMTSNGAFCSGRDPSIDASVKSDARPPDSAPGCLGSGLVTNICQMPPPTAEITISANRTINTAMVGAGNCDQIVAQQLGGPSMCMIAGKTISIAAGAKLIAQGPNPLLLVAHDTFDVTGAIDVASHVNAPTPGAGSETTCTSGNGGNGSGNDGGGGGGGAGGTFGTLGANGGTGDDTGGTGGTSGTAIAAMAAGSLRGGCKGGNGGGGGSGGSGVGGAGGGGIYLIARTSITIGGSINASGAPGAGGFNGSTASGGGGGGGSGGLIALDAPMITVTGSLFANGGGGGGGGGEAFDKVGSAGGEPTTATTQANGGNGGDGGGGNGGRGYALNQNATNGNNGNNRYCGGAGGGGGAGVIKIYGTSTAMLTGTISPPATQ